QPHLENAPSLRLIRYPVGRHCGALTGSQVAVEHGAGLAGSSGGGRPLHQGDVVSPNHPLPPSSVSPTSLARRRNRSSRERAIPSAMAGRSISPIGGSHASGSSLGSIHPRHDAASLAAPHADRSASDTTRRGRSNAVEIAATQASSRTPPPPTRSGTSVESAPPMAASASAVASATPSKTARRRWPGPWCPPRWKNAPVELERETGNRSPAR